MTPKEKAKELVEKYAYHLWIGSVCDYDKAKECALIAVDEILNLIVGIYDYDYNSLNPYWQGVKEEIKKL